MKENLKMKLLVVLALLLGSIYVSAPSLGIFPTVADIDQNGILTEVDFRAYHKERLQKDAQFIKQYDADSDGQISEDEWASVFATEKDRLGLERDPRGLRKFFYEREVTLGLDLRGGIDLIYKVESPNELQSAQEYAALVRKTVEVLKNRIDMLKITEPVVQRYDDSHIRVQLAGNFDETQVKAVMGQTDLLKFQKVAGHADSPVQFGANANDPRYEIVPSTIPRGKDGQPTGERTFYLLEREVPLTGDTIDGAFPSFDQFGKPQISLRFNSEGAKIFASLTRGMVGEQLAIVLGGEVYMAPNIKEAITSGECSIEGAFDVNYVRGIVDVLKAGSLPSKLVLENEAKVGATLGQDSVNRGLRAGQMGLALVFILMIAWYGKAGVIACLSLSLNLLLLLTILILLKATLTLPGIAGLILTVGMSVDANILIFQRIREELQIGKTAIAAIEAGFEKALSAILDSNITTILTCLILFNFGSGPLQGFAVTLTIGIMTSMFTAIIVTKVLMYTFMVGKDNRAFSV